MYRNLYNYYRVAGARMNKGGSLTSSISGCMETLISCYHPRLLHHQHLVYWRSSWIFRWSSGEIWRSSSSWCFQSSCCSAAAGGGGVVGVWSPARPWQLGLCRRGSRPQNWCSTYYSRLWNVWVGVSNGGNRFGDNGWGQQVGGNMGGVKYEQ